MSYFGSGTNSPPPLRHPVPTHPAYIPEPPLTPDSPTPGYQRFSSSPGPPQQQQAGPSFPQPHHVPAYSSYQPKISQPATTGFPPPTTFAGWGVNDATAQIGIQLGNSAVAAGQQYVHKNFGGFFQGIGLKHRFNVSNVYVIKKLKVVVFPWMHRPWARRIRRSEQGQTEWHAPRDDVNSPDLYIPVMAFVTYILVAGFISGHPKALSESASGAFVVVLVDFGFVYLGCYFLNIENSSQALDIVAYSSYKFVGVICTILSGFLLGRTLWTIIFIYFFLANAFFLLRSLRSVVLPDRSITPNAGTATLSQSSRRRRITFLFLEAVCQILYMGILCYAGIPRKQAEATAI